MTFEEWGDRKNRYSCCDMQMYPDWKTERTKFIEGLREIADNLDTPIAIAKIARRLLEKK